MKGYVFLSNSSKPCESEQNSREPIRLTNVSRPCLQTALEMGYKVLLGVNRADPEELECELPVHKYDSHTYRSVTDFKSNFTAYKNLMKVLKNNDIDVIHCNTPIGGVIGRLCGKRAKTRKIIYTAHGFHFYKGAPKLNWMLYYPAERLLAHWTDILITINHEDYEAAKKFKLRKNGKVYYIPGVGINLDKFKPKNIDRTEKRREIGVSDDDIVIFSAGDLNVNKNHSVVINAIAELENPNIHYVIAGKGDQKDSLVSLADELGICKQIHLIGYRSDMADLFQSSDICCFPSIREGLGLAALEGMACGLPVIASDNRGTREYCFDGENAFVCRSDSVEDFRNAIEKLSSDKELRIEMGRKSLETVQKFSVENTKKEIKNIYNTLAE